MWPATATVELELIFRMPDRLTGQPKCLERRKGESESDRLLRAIQPGDVVVALDERGEPATSASFAQKLGGWRDAGQEVTFLIGGADGLDDALRARADWQLALGRLTWPHLLVRLLLVEQLYRASTILAGHPYHRA